MTRRWGVWVLVALVGVAVMSGWTRLALTQGTTVALNPAADTTLKQEEKEEIKEEMGRNGGHSHYSVEDGQGRQ